MTEQEQADDDRFLAYENKTAEYRLRILADFRMKATDPRQAGFFEGRMLEATIGMEQHPDWYEWGCLCHECQTCG